MSGFNPQAWQSTSIDSGSEPPDPGTYEVVLTDASAFTASKGGDYVKLAWKVASGSEAGYEWDVLSGFGSEGAIKMTKGTCARLGVDVAAVVSLDQLDSELKAKVGQWYAVDVKQNGEYRNTYITGQVTAGLTTDVPAPEEDFEPAAVGADDDGVPF